MPRCYNFRMVRFALILFALPLFAQTYDLVIANGRVLDPAGNLDAVRHIGIRGGKIAAVSAAPLAARNTVDATGLVVAPGFIDLHSHGQTPRTIASRRATASPPRSKWRSASTPSPPGTRSAKAAR